MPTPEDTNFDSNTMFQVSGWGSNGWDETSNQYIKSPKLKDIYVKWATDEACQEYWEGTKEKRTPAVKIASNLLGPSTFFQFMAPLVISGVLYY